MIKKFRDMIKDDTEIIDIDFEEPFLPEDNHGLHQARRALAEKEQVGNHKGHYGPERNSWRWELY